MNAESIFVSYSSKDRPFALGLVKELQKLGANVWIDQLGIGLGENWDNAIEEALENSNTFLLIISPTAVKSQNVQDEVSIAINTNKKFVPIMIKQCDLPMRWQRKQYADLTANPDKAVTDVLRFLGLEEKAAANLKKILALIGIGEAIDTSEDELVHENSPSSKEVLSTNLNDLLISEAEIDRATKMHKKGITKNWQMIAIVGALSLVLLCLALFTDIITVDTPLAIVACLSLNLLSIKPFGGIKKRIRNIDLMDLLKLKRERLLRVMNKLNTTEINKFNEEFYTYITV